MCLTWVQHDGYTVPIYSRGRCGIRHHASWSKTLEIFYSVALLINKSLMKQHLYSTLSAVITLEVHWNRYTTERVQQTLQGEIYTRHAEGTLRNIALKIYKDNLQCRKYGNILFPFLQGIGQKSSHWIYIGTNAVQPSHRYISCKA